MLPLHQRNAMSPERLHIDISPGAWSERGITAMTLQTPTSTAVGKAPSTKPSRWKTTEFLVYGVIAAVLIPYMVYVPIRLSQRTSISWLMLQSSSSMLIQDLIAWHPNYQKYEYKLSPGWIAGRKVVCRPTSSYSPYRFSIRRTTATTNGATFVITSYPSSHWPSGILAHPFSTPASPTPAAPSRVSGVTTSRACPS